MKEGGGGKRNGVKKLKEIKKEITLRNNCLMEEILYNF